MTSPATTLPFPTPDPIDKRRGSRTHWRRLAVWLTVNFLAVCVAACGGGGGDATTAETPAVPGSPGSPASPTTPTTPAPAVAPGIATPPVAQTVTAGTAATFIVKATGSDPLQYQWKRNGADIAGATAASYTTPATTVAADDGALYSVVVSNATGTATSDAVRLTVTAATVPASITTPPVAQTVTAGQTATFSVVADGTGPLSYQWKRNGVDITGATAASHTTPTVTTADNGALYTVVVSNSAGTATSSSALLSVADAPSSLSGRAWTPGQLAATGASIQTGSATATAIDAQGRVTVLFGKQVGAALALHAVRGEPGPAGASPVFGSAVVIDTGAPFNAASGVTLAVSPSGNAIAGWVRRAPCVAGTYNSNTSATCNYYYNARYLVATGAWETPRLVNDMYVPAFVASINDAGDVAALLSETIPQQDLSARLIVGWRASGQADYTRRAWPVDVNGTFIPQGVTLDSAGRLLVAGTMTQPLSRNTDIAAYRGTVTGGLGAIETVDLRGATASFIGAWSNPAGQAVLMWSQDNGSRASVFAATLDAADAAWSVTDTAQTPPAAGAAIPAALSAEGDFVWYFFGRCTAQRRTAGVWSSPAALPAALCGATGVPGTPALSANGNVVTLNPADGGWLAYDAKLNQVFNPLPHAASGPAYLLGFPKATSSLPGTLLLANNGTGAYVSLNAYSALPTAAAPNGDSQGVVGVWAWYFK